MLAQWRLEHLAHGARGRLAVGQPQDDPQRLVQSLALAVRARAGRPTFGHTLLEAAGPGGLEGITVWLAEVAQTALDVVLVVDEAERLPPASREALAYLLRNAPPNLRVVVAARPDCQLDIDDLVAYGQCVVVGPAALRFQLDETLELVRSRFGARVDNDTAARLHELTEGWPLGLQLALTVMARGADARSRVAAWRRSAASCATTSSSLLLANLDPGRRRLPGAHLDPGPPASRAVPRASRRPTTRAERLARLGRDTPVFAAAEQGDWLRMHTLARDVLRERFAALPAAAAGRSCMRARRTGWPSTACSKTPPGMR